MGLTMLGSASADPATTTATATTATAPFPRRPARAQVAHPVCVVDSADSVVRFDDAGLW